MANPIVTVIDRAAKAAWPQVSAGVAQTHRSMLELAGVSEEVVPKVEEWISRGDGAPVRRRKICEETVWVLAELGWLRTGGERDVILAAKKLGDAVAENAMDDDIVKLEDDLIEVVQSLPEYLTTKES